MKPPKKRKTSSDPSPGIEPMSPEEVALNTTSEVLTRMEAAAYLRMSRTTFDELLKKYSSVLLPVVIDRRPRFLRSNLRKFVESRQIELLDLD